MKIGYPKGDNYKLVLAGLQPCQRRYIECLASCSEEELFLHLQTFTQWVWEKSDIICWAPVLNRFDDLFNRYVTLLKDSSGQFPSPENVELVKSALKTSIMIVENCTSKNTYNSLDLLIHLLDDVNLDIVFLATRLLSVFFSSRNRRMALSKEISLVITRLSTFIENPLPDKTCNIASTTPTEFTRKIDQETLPMVLDHYFCANRYWLSSESFVEIDIGRPELLKIPVFEVLSVGDVNFTALREWVLSLKNQDLFPQVLKSFRVLIDKYQIEDRYHHVLKYKIAKIFSLYFPSLQRTIVNIRLSSLICLLLINTSLYSQFLTYNPSFLLELSYFIKFHRFIDRSTMIIASELLSAMIYDGIQYKLLSNLLGFMVPHGIFVKVLKFYLNHVHESEKSTLDIQHMESCSGAGKREQLNCDEPFTFSSTSLDESMAVDAATPIHATFYIGGDEEKWNWDLRLSTEELRAQVAEDEEFMRILLQLLIVYYSIISYHGNCSALTSIGVLDSLVKFIRIRNPIYTPVIIYVVQVLEALLDYNQAVSRSLRNDLQLFHVFISRIQYDMHKIQNFIHFGNLDADLKPWPNGWNLPDVKMEMVLRTYWLSLSEISARRFLFKTIVKDIYSVTRPYSIRNEINDHDVFGPGSPMISVVLEIFKDPKSYGLGIYSSAITLILDVIGEDPISQEDLHRLGIIPAFLNSISEESLKSEDCLSIIPTAICDLFLHKSGQEYIKNNNYKHVLRLVDIVVKREFVLFDRFGEVAASIGISLDTIVRQHESSHSIIMRHVIQVIFDLLQESLQFPSFIPCDPKKYSERVDSYLQQFRTTSAEITIEMLSTLDKCSSHDFYADRIANLGKFLSTFLSFGQSISHFISCDGIKLLMQLCTAPCLPPLFFSVYPQHPLVLATKYILSQAVAPSIVYLHSLCKPYVGPELFDRTTPMDNINWRASHGTNHFLYSMHKDNTGIYTAGCCGQHQMGVQLKNLSTCEMHTTLTLWLESFVFGFPGLLHTFHASLSDTDKETAFFLSSKHNSHEHPQLRGFKSFINDAKNANTDALFSANDLFWSSQCTYAYSLPNSAFSGGHLSHERRALSLEMCRLTLIASRSLLFSLNASVNKALRGLKPENECLKAHIAKNSYSIATAVMMLANEFPDVKKWQSSEPVFLKNMDCIKTARYFAEFMEFVYKLCIDEKNNNSLFALTTCMITGLDGMKTITSIFDYLLSLYIACSLAIALRLNPSLSCNDVLGIEVTNHTSLFNFVIATANALTSHDLKWIKSSMVVLGKTIQVALSLFCRLCNPRTMLNVTVDSNLREFISRHFCPENMDLPCSLKDHTSCSSKCHISIGQIFKNIVATISSTCWPWLKVFSQMQPSLPSSSTASIGFYISPKMLSSLLKVHVYILDYASSSRQQALNLFFLKMDTSLGEPSSEMEGISSSNLIQPFLGTNMRRNRRLRNREVNSNRELANSGDEANDTDGDYELDSTGRIQNMDSVRSHLSEMGFSDRDISNAISHCGISDLLTLTDWLINVSEFNQNVPEFADLPLTSNHNERYETISKTIKDSSLFSDFETLPMPFFAQDADVVVYIEDVDLNVVPEIRRNIIKLLLMFCKNMPITLSVISDCLFRILALKLDVVYDDEINASSFGGIYNVESTHDKNILHILAFIHREIKTVHSQISQTQVNFGSEDIASIFSPIIFMNETDRQTAFERAVCGGKTRLDEPYNYSMAKTHEYLASLFYLLAYLLGGRESYTHLALMFDDFVDVIFSIIELFHKMRLDAYNSGVITLASMGLKKALPDISVNIPEWCLLGSGDSTGPSEYDMVKYGFCCTSRVPQVASPPPFFKFAFICIVEFMKKYNLFDLSGLYTENDEKIKIVTSCSTRFIKKDMQEKLLNLCMGISELFPGLDADLLLPILCIVDKLTEVCSNSEKLLQYKPVTFHQSKSINRQNLGSLRILLNIPKSAQCKGILRLVSNIFVHCLESRNTLEESMKDRIIGILSSADTLSMPLDKFVQEVYPFVKKDPLLLLDLLKRHTVITIQSSEVHEENEQSYIEVKDLTIALKSANFLKDALMEEMMGTGKNVNMDAVDYETLYAKKNLHISRLLLEHMHIFGNIHGLTNTLPKSKSKPLYPFSLTLNSVFFLLNAIFHNFPLPESIRDGAALNIPIELPYKPLPWKFDKIERCNSKSLVIFLSRYMFTMICSLSAPKNMSTPDEASVQSKAEFEAVQKLIIDSLENYTNTLILLALSSSEFCLTIISEIGNLLQSFVGLDMAECGVYLFPIAIYTLCNLLHHLLQIPFDHVQVSSETFTQLKKALTSLFHKIDLFKDESKIVCGSIVRVLVLLTSPSKNVELVDNDSSAEPSALVVELADDSSSDDSSLNMEVDLESDEESESEVSEIDEEISGEEDDEEMADDEDMSSEDMSDTEDEGDDDDGDDVDNDNIMEDITDDLNDIEMALPHQIDEEYASNHYSDSASSSSMDDVEEDEDDVPRIRVAGELDETNMDHNVQEVIENPETNLSIADDADEDSEFSGSQSDSAPLTTSVEQIISDSVPLLNNLSFPVSDGSSRQTSASRNQNGTIHIEIQFGNNQRAVRYLNNPNRISQTESASVQMQQGQPRNETWSNSGDLEVPEKHPLLPSTKKQLCSFDMDSDFMNIIALNVQKVQVRNDPIVPEQTEEICESPQDEENMETENVDAVHTNVEQNSSAENTSESAYESRSLRIIAQALGISYNDLFGLANMDPSVISELPYDLRDEIISQQLNTINVDAVASMRDVRARNTLSPAITAIPSRNELQYLESLPRSLRLDVLRSLYGDNSNEADEINATLDLDGDNASFMAALLPSLRAEILHGSNQPRGDDTANEARHTLSDSSNQISVNVQQDASSQQAAASVTDLGRHRSPGVTLGFIIGEIQAATNQLRRLTNIHTRSRGSANRRIMNRDSNDSSFNTNDVLFVTDRRTRGSRFTNFENLGRFSLNGAEVDGVVAEGQSSSGTNNALGLDRRILQSIPHLLNTFEPQLINILQPRGAPANVASASQSFDVSNLLEANDVTFDSVVENILGLLPKSPCARDSNLTENERTLLSYCGLSRSDWNTMGIIGICKVFYLKSEINKKMFFKLLYNLASFGGPVCDTLLKLFLVMISSSILSVNAESTCTDINDSFFKNLPKICNVKNASFPPKQTFSSSCKETVESGTKNPQNTASQLFQGSVTSSVSLNSSYCSYVSSEKVLEQLRSLLIALPSTISFFSNSISTPSSEEIVTSQELKRKKKRLSTSTLKNTPSIYPINFFFSATATHLFQSSTKHMNHLLMIIHNLIVAPENNIPADTQKDFSNCIDLVSSENNMLETCALASSSPSEPNNVQKAIIDSLDEESLGLFLNVYSSWKCPSSWVQFCNIRDISSQNQLRIIAQIFGALYNSKHSQFITGVFKEKCLLLIDLVSTKLRVTKSLACTDQDLEPIIFALLRVVTLVNEMFTEAYKPKESENTPVLKLSTDFYRNLPFERIWKALDDVMLSLMDNNALDSHEISAFERLRGLIPLLEVYLLISQGNIAMEYNLDHISKLEETLSLIDFDIDAQKQTREKWDNDSSHLELSSTHLDLINFVERHKNAINIIVKQSPSLLNSGFQPVVRLAPMCLNFDIKRQYFRIKLKEKRQGIRLEPIKITVRRKHVFLDSYHQLRLRSGDEMKGKLTVSFGGEEGVDAGGLTREWFTILSKEMFNPNYGLFTREGRKQEFNHPNPLSGINPDHLNFFKFIGRVIGKALYDGHHMDAYFCRSFYKHMLGRKITPADAESVDPQFYENLISIDKYSLKDLDLELYFSTEIDEFGKVKVIDLIPNGRNIPVTDENKHKYIELLCRHKVTNGIKEQLDAFMAGFRELICPQLISIFDDRELELLISGIPTIDLQNMKQNVDYVNYTENSEQIVWFWEILEELDQNHLAAFLQFVTGTSRVPIGGFKNLMGMRGPQRISIHKTFGDNRLPTAHTCFNQLDLPAYPDKHMLKSKLLQAILEGKEGFGFI
ncbi:ubiquitin-protein ligase 1, putative [Theileria equi strain WA]|uniref:HECT-type E3 ubiquitin transferase n=1 Tax=Theileria equi strain WA TaxID=1537102 RepID=L0AXT0_THEEQ|nr:ubiquitin-protein ligase 1, putative [Theileria equi strain WA]AFZ80372.1 ubiquitin-protein ligase 1, putative [Theileria equi strain WA]|eukprot:XP_004830038.1 ubiquitin-protein ligase 1, putative [Theileria equi strain WA]